MNLFRILITLAIALVSIPAAAQRGTVPVNIATTPAGATVYVDSVETPAIGVTPLSRVRIARGNHTLIFRLANHTDAQLPVNIRRWNESFTQELAALGVITISAGAPEMTGAEVRIDGVAEGVIPLRMNVEPGRHLIQIGQEGYVTYSQWAEVAGGQIFALPVLMQREAPRTGSLLIAGDVSGAAITIDGTPRGTTPAVIDGLAEGQHTVQIAPVAPGQVAFEQTVLITAGERAVVHPTMQPAPPAGGSLRILANAEGAVIRLDGEVLGNAPATRADIAPGDHIIEASAPGYEPLQQPVTIEAGRQQVVSLALVAVQRAAGVIVINSDVDNATVTVDGTERGTTPVVIEDAPPGVHPVIVTAPGRAPFRTTCTTAPGQDCRIMAELASAPVNVVFRANVDSGVLLVDGQEIGPVPFEGTIPAGYAQWSSAERQRFLDNIPKQRTAGQLAALNEVLGLSGTGNNEELFLWLELALANRYEPAVPQAEEFLAEVGRAKFVRPLFQVLWDQDEWGRPIAQRIYAETRDSYHAVTRGGVDRILGTEG